MLEDPQKLNLEEQLPSLVGSRICHDLINPMGAINNGLELLQLVQDDSSEEMALIRASADSAATKIRFFRIAFGSASPGQTVSPTEITGILANLSKSGRCDVSWTTDAEFERETAKLVFLAALCLESALTSGGQIRAKTLNATTQIDAFGTNIKFEDTLWQEIRNPIGADDLSASTVHFALLGLELSRLGRPIDFDHMEGSIRLRF